MKKKKKKKKKKKRKKSGQLHFPPRRSLKLKLLILASFPAWLLGFSSRSLLHRSDPFLLLSPFNSNFHLVCVVVSSFLAEVFNARAELADEYEYWFKPHIFFFVLLRLLSLKQIYFPFRFDFLKGYIDREKGLVL
ncbi:hypothetical protein SDJN02_17274, partial [Cucurbita argyrosperma subsp. argyrosperma]